MNRFFIAFQILILTASCNKDGVNPMRIGYPAGFTVSDTTSISDCTLAECAEERVVRLLAKDIVDFIGFDSVSQRYVTGFPYSFDSYVLLYLCDLPEEFQESGIKVKYSGELRDACGYYYPIFPYEETYILKLSSIAME